MTGAGSELRRRQAEIRCGSLESAPNMRVGRSRIDVTAPLHRDVEAEGLGLTPGSLDERLLEGSQASRSIAYKDAILLQK